ncbi:MAG TPA: type II secretion system protein GspG [Polyangia bacterium]
MNQEELMDPRMQGRLAQRRRRGRGMTLVEIMVVVAIIGMIMGAVAVGAMSQLEKAKVKNTKMIIHNVQEALVHYATDNTDSCPKALSELVSQKYLNKDPKDDWGQPLMYVCPSTHGGDSADVWSKGKDKQDGTADDIRSWEQ